MLFGKDECSTFRMISLVLCPNNDVFRLVMFTTIMDVMSLLISKVIRLDGLICVVIFVVWFVGALPCGLARGRDVIQGRLISALP